MAQSYLGKPPISKGIGRGIRRFVIVAFALHALAVSRKNLQDATEGCEPARIPATGCEASPSFNCSA
jgi:hypothetical protein